MADSGGSKIAASLRRSFELVISAGTSKSLVAILCYWSCPESINIDLFHVSADPLKRQRGRRGLEVLQRLQKMPHIDVEVIEDDFPQVPEVDLKLIEVAKRYDCKIVTNDFNLNKVASVQGLEILNVNQLANALKPVVLPGEVMRVFILREGKEYNQGVAYLDDGTMVVVDGARKMINKTIDITVTSVHQTTAGKMIFGRLDERMEHPRTTPHANLENTRHSEPVVPIAVPERGPRPVYPESSRE